MIALIIFGTKGVTSMVGAGTFMCPGCTAQAHYEHKKIRRFFSLYWIPIIPIGTVADYVECLTCRSTFDPQVLGATPG